MDLKFFAAHRAAKRDRTSTDPEFHFLLANLALHSTILILATDDMRAADECHWISAFAGMTTFIPQSAFRNVSFHNIKLDRQFPELRRRDP